MPSVQRKGKKGVYVELEESQLEALKAFADAQGTGFAFEVRDAIRRHLAYPPRRDPEPLPDAAGAPRAGEGTTPAGQAAGPAEGKPAAGKARPGRKR